MDGLTKLIPPPVRSKANPSLAGQGGAQIEATVPTNLNRGQVVKHHILWVIRPKPIIRQQLCSWDADQEPGSGRRGMNRESTISLAQAVLERNAFCSRLLFALVKAI